VNANEVQHVQPITGKGALRGIVRVRLGCVEIAGCRVLQQNGGDPWVAMPQAPVRKGGSGWLPMVEITRRDVLAQVNAAILDAWRAAGGER
jgi:hypothetical protein